MSMLCVKRWCKSISWLPLLLCTFFFVDSVYTSFTSHCIPNGCNQHTSNITCNQSLILILDVTNLQMKRDRSAFEKTKRICIAKSSCDLSEICSPGIRSWLLVHFFCVDDRLIQNTSCDGRVSKIQGKYGFIQSPGYPITTAMYIPCRWQFNLSNDTFVTLYVHDVATNGTKESCDGGLIVSGSNCDGKGQFATRLLCGGDELTTLVRCGKVDVELSASKGLYPLRFWLSFYVQSKLQPANLWAPIRSCSGWLYTMDNSQRVGGKNYEQVTGDTVATTPSSNAHNNTQIFIILLCIFCGITVVLLVILIIVCIRCRQIKLSVSDHVYSEPSHHLQAHYDYISSLDDDKPRPKLVDEYFEVADALPIDQRRNLPSSPAYAEVEQFAHLKKDKWSSLGSSDWSEGQVTSNIPEGTENNQRSDYMTCQKSNTAAPIKKMVSERFPENPKLKLKGDSHNQNDTGPKVFVVNLKADNSHPVHHKKVKCKSQEDDNSDCDDSSTYEQIEVYSSQHNNPQSTEAGRPGNRSLLVPQGQKVNDKRKQDKSNHKYKKADWTTRSNVRKASNSPSRINQIKEGLLSKNNNVNTGLLAEKERPRNSRNCEEKNPSNCDNRELDEFHTGHKSLNAREDAQKIRKTTQSDVQNPAKSIGLKDGPRTTRGIVRNGIQKFEHNTAL